MEGDTTQKQQQHSQLLFPLLARKSSVYSLTLDEVQNHLGNLGKPLGSMNLSELLKNIHSTTKHATPSLSGVQHNFSTSMSKKTVDEVWRDIQKNCEENIAQQQGELAFGEMTLEDFLLKAGVRPQTSSSSDENYRVLHSFVQRRNQWVQYPLPPPIQQQQETVTGVFVPGLAVPLPIPVVTRAHLEVTYPENPIAITSPLKGTLSDTRPSRCKRRATGGATEKTTEKKQKRMIKNRESAARSRTKKQEYTNSLEIKVSRLEELNERLRNQQKLKRMLQCAPPPEPKVQLRRTSSAKF